MTLSIERSVRTVLNFSLTVGSVVVLSAPALNYLKVIPTERQVQNDNNKFDGGDMSRAVLRNYFNNIATVGMLCFGTRVKIF